MRIVEVQFDSAEAKEYNFLGCVLHGITNEPFHLRHEYYEQEKNVKQALYLFGKRTEERGTQLFVGKYFDFRSNAKFEEDLKLYKAQESNFRLPDKSKLTPTYLLNEAVGEQHRHQFMTKDGKYRRRIVYEIKGDRNALLIVFSLDSKLFNSNQLFQFVKTNFEIMIE